MLDISSKEGMSLQGSYGFSSDIVAHDSNSALSLVDHWPRFQGVPFYVVSMSQLKLKEQTSDYPEHKIESMCFKAVLVNPIQLALASRYQTTKGSEDQDQARAILKRSILHALSQEAVVEFKFSHDDALKLATGKIDWRFPPHSSNSVEAEGRRHLGASLNRIHGEVTTKNQDSSLRIEVKKETSSALIIESLWTLTTTLVLKPDSEFEQKTEKDKTIIKQKTYTFLSERIEGKDDKLNLYTQEKCPLYYHLPVNFGKELEQANKNKSLSLNGAIKSVKSVNDEDPCQQPYLDLKLQRGNDQSNISLSLIQEDQYGFLIDQVSSNAEKDALILWSENSKNNQKSLSVHYIENSLNLSEVPIKGSNYYYDFTKLTLAYEDPDDGHKLALSSDSFVLEYHSGLRVLSRSRAYSSAPFKLTDQSLEELSKKNVPDKIVKLLNLEYKNEGQFIEALKNTIGDKDTEAYKVVILNTAGNSWRQSLLLTAGYRAEKKMGGMEVTLQLTEQDLSDFINQDDFKLHADKGYTKDAFLRIKQENQTEWQGFTKVNFHLLGQEKELVICFPRTFFYAREVKFKDRSEKFNSSNSSTSSRKTVANGIKRINKPDANWIERIIERIIETETDSTSKMKDYQFFFNEVEEVADTSEQAKPTSLFIQLDVEAIKQNQTDRVLASPPNCRFKKTLIDSDRVPVNLCLEKDVVKPVDKLLPTVPSLIHRQFYGNYLRVALPAKMVSEENLSRRKGKSELKEDAPEDYSGNWLINPLTINEDKKIVVMNDNLFLTSHEEELKAASHSTDVQTTNALNSESLLVFLRPNQVNQHDLPYVALTNKSVEYASGFYQGGNSHERAEDLLLQSKINGVAIYQHMNNLSKVCYEFLSTKTRERGKNASFEETGVNHLASLMLFKEPVSDLHDMPTERVQAKKIEKLSPFIIEPEKLSRHSHMNEDERYQPIPLDETHDDKHQAVCGCKVTRGLAYKYANDALNQLPSQGLPSILMTDLPAYEGGDKIAFLPKTKPQLPINAMDEKKGMGTFLPFQYTLKYGADKPGAMFHHYNRNLTYLGQKNLSYHFGQPNLFAMREPQQVKVVGCVSADLRADLRNVNLQDEITQDDLYIYHATLNWEDVIGEVEVTNELSDGPDVHSLEEKNTSDLRYSFAKGYVFYETIIRHNYEVLKLERSHQVLSVYQDERTGFSWWPDLSLVSKKGCLKAGGNILTLMIPIPPDGEKEFPFHLKPHLSTVFFDKLEPLSGEDPLPFFQINGNNSFLDYLAYLYKQNNLQKKPEVFVPGLKSTVRGPYQIKNIKEVGNNGDKSYQIYLEQKGTEEEVPIEADSTLTGCYFLTPMTDEIIKNISTEDLLSHGSLKLDQFKIDPQNTAHHFQILWLDYQETVPNSEGKKITQSAYVTLFDKPLTFRYLMPAILKPKVAAVMRFKKEGKPDYETTAFFGDAKDAIASRPKLTKQAGTNPYQFSYFIEDSEKLWVEYPKAYHPASLAQLTYELFVVKYLTGGQTVFAVKAKEAVKEDTNA